MEAHFVMRSRIQEKYYIKRQTEYWLKAAEDDLIVIREIIRNDSLTNMVAFHSQQTIEKSIKAVLEEKENHVPRIHNIITLNAMIWGKWNGWLSKS